jgi:DNA-binding NarL/FixJ family response regulator
VSGENRPDLTPAQWRVLAALASGATVRQIALRLGISDHGVRFHLRGICRHLGLAGADDPAAAAVAWYRHEGHRYHKGVG